MAVRADTHLRPEAVPTLWRLRRAGVRLAVVSDCAWELPEIMRSLPVDRLLDAKVYSVQVGCSKPDPRIYLAACARLGVAPEDCVFVGDGGSRELTGAQALGIRAIRLAAPDLADHLQFASDDGFAGESAVTLADAAALAMTPNPWGMTTRRRALRGGPHPAPPLRGGPAAAQTRSSVWKGTFCNA
ncbi:HAD family hydrolase [Catellatospora coxensis]